MDTAVYYWRSKYEFPKANESDEWAVSSFNVIDGASPGWAQLDYFQQIENRLSGLKRNDSREEFSFLNSEVTLDIRVPGNHADTIFYHDPSKTIVRDAQITINGVNYLTIVDGFQPYNYCYNNRLNIVAFDKETSLN